MELLRRATRRGPKNAEPPDPSTTVSPMEPVNLGDRGQGTGDSEAYIPQPVDVAAEEAAPGPVELPGEERTAEVGAESRLPSPSAAGRRRRRSATTTESPVLVDVDVPRGPGPRVDKKPVQRAVQLALESPVAVDVDVPRGLGPRVDKKLVLRAVQLALARAGWERPATLDVHMVTNDQMRELNASRCGVDQPTDVLSFPLLDLAPDKGLTQDFFVLPPEQILHLGDVVISVDRVDVQAQAGGHSRERELAFLTVHGVLHILGYDHDTMPARRVMRRREEEILGEMGLRRDGA